jgi:type II secretory pathway pseudopilin PulG
MPFYGVLDSILMGVVNTQVMTKQTVQFRFLRYLEGGASTRHSGFTLIEKIIIVAVMGILGAVAAPNLSKLLDRAKLDQATQEVRSALDETQREAIRGNKSCVVTLNLVESKVTGTCLQSGNRDLPQKISLATNMVSNLDASVPSSTARSTPMVTDVVLGLGLDGDRPTQVAVATEPDAPKASMTIQIISQAVNSSIGDLNCSATVREAAVNCSNKQPSPSPSEGPTASPSPQPSNPSEQPGVTVMPIPVQYGALGTPNFAVVSALERPADPTGKIVFYLADNEGVQRKCIAISNTLGLTRIGSYRGVLEPSKITDEGACTAAGWITQ